MAGVVLLAAPGRPLPRIIVDQLRFLGSMPPAELATVETQAQRIPGGPSRSHREADERARALFIDLLKRDAFATARSLRKAILLLRGDRDFQVTDEDQDLWQRALSGRPDFQAFTLPDLNHLFMSGSGPPGPQEYNRPGRVHASVSVRISAFVKQTLATAPR